MTTRLHIWSLDRMLVCVPSNAPTPLTDSLRAALLEQPSIDAVLAVLTSGGLADTPAFLCSAVVPDGVRVLIRGDLRAVAHGPGLSVPLSAGRSETWHDDVITDIRSITFDADPGEGEPAATFEWIATTQRAPEQTDLVATSPVSPIPADTPAVGVEPESRTLREPEFAALAAEVIDTVDHEPSDAIAPADDAPAVAADPLDFSNLLDSTEAPQSAPDLSAATVPPDAIPSEHEPEPTARPVPQPEPATPAQPPPGIEGGAPRSQTPISTVPGAVPVSPGPTDAAPPSATPVVPPASVPAPEPTPVAAVTSGLGDHDGYTMTLADLQRLRQDAEANEGAEAEPSTTAPDPVRPGEIHAVQCPAGHANPPTSTQCRVCGQVIADTGVFVLPRPTLARLVFDSGLVVDVDRPQIIGRKPTAPPDEDDIPNLIAIPSPDSDISRSHTRVVIEGWDLLVEDVGSTNGTEVRLPNQDPVRIREFEPILVVPGTEVTLAQAVRFRVDPPAP